MVCHKQDRGRASLLLGRGVMACSLTACQGPGLRRVGVALQRRRGPTFPFALDPAFSPHTTERASSGQARAAGSHSVFQLSGRSCVRTALTKEVPVPPAPSPAVPKGRFLMTGGQRPLAGAQRKGPLRSLVIVPHRRTDCSPLWG